MTPAERNKAFRSERARQLRLGVDLRLRTVDTVLRLLGEARQTIQARLAAQPSEWQSWHLSGLQEEVRRAMTSFETGLSTSLLGGVREAWAAGARLVDAPIEAGGITLTGRLPQLDTGVLMAMQSFLTDRARDVSTTMANRINGEMANTIMGLQTPAQAVTAVERHLKGGAGRATTIVNLELGRAYSVAGQKRMEQASPILPGLRKQWRRSGKREARYSHMLADGQVVKVDQPFLVAGVKLMCPRDPAGPLEHTINCGCTSLPIMKSWEVMHPGEKPISAEEKASSRDARKADEVRQRTTARVIEDLLAGKRKAQGQFLTVGQITPDIQAKLAEKGHAVATAEIAIGDRQILHMERDAKKARGVAVPPAILPTLPDIMARPENVYLEVKDQGAQLIYVAKVPGEARLASFPVKLRDRDTRMAQHRHNFIATAAMVPESTFADKQRFIKL